MKSRWCAAIVQLVIGTLLLARSGPAADRPPGINALELAEQSPDAVMKVLGPLRLSYRGESPDSLLMLAELMLKKDGRAGEEVWSSVTANQSFRPCLDTIVDILYECPSPRQTEAVRGRLEHTSRWTRLTGLLVAGGGADEPAVAALLRTIARKQDTPAAREEAVMAILALGESGREETLAFVAGLAHSSHAPVRAAARTAAYRIRATLGKIAIPPLNEAEPVPAVLLVGGRLLEDYRRLPRVKAATDAAGFVAVEMPPYGRNPFSEPVLAAMARALKSGGAVVISSAGKSDWPAALKVWARANGVDLPSRVQNVRGSGMPNYAQYRTVADFPYSPCDQSDTAADRCWLKWGDAQAAPIVTARGNGALVVVQENVLGKGRVLFTTIDLGTRPIYRENVLRWVYGENLLAYAYQYVKAYSLDVTGRTAHRAWAKPLAAAPPRVLYLTSSQFKRGMLEIVQRADVDWRYVPYDATFAFPPTMKNEPPPRMAQRAVCMLENTLGWAEVLVFEVGQRNLIRSLVKGKDGAVSLAAAPRRLRRRIYRRVWTDGMGLVGVSNPRGHESVPLFVDRASADATASKAFGATADLTLPFPQEDGLDNHAGVPRLRRAPFGKGRILWLGVQLGNISGQAGIPPKFELPDSYAVPGLVKPFSPVRPDEYWYALLVKSILWAAAHDARAQMRELTVTPGAAGTATAVRVGLDRALTGTVEIAVRDAYDGLRPTQKAPIKGTEGTVETPALPNGWYVAEVQVKDAPGKVVDFGARLFRVASDLRIVKITHDKAFYKPGDTATLTVHCSSPFSGTARVEAIDTWQRKTFAATRTITGPGAEFVVKVPLKNALSRLWDVHVTLVRDERAISHLRQPIGIALPLRELDFDVSASIRTRGLARFFKERMGANVTYGDPERFLRHNFDFASGSWSSPIGAMPTPGVRLVPTERQPCLSSPSYRLRAIKDMREKGPLFRTLGVTDYMVSDECPIGGRDFSAHTLARFRDWLRRRYGTLDALNREWGTTCKMWHDVQPLEGTTAERPGATMEFDLFTHWVFAEYCSFIEILGNDYIPGVRAGHSGGVHDNVMMDLAGSLYYYGVIEPAVSVKRPGAVIGCWYAPGYRFTERHETQCRHWPWWHLFRGTTRIQLWYPISGPAAYHEDWSRPYKAFAWLKEEMDDIRLGVGKLLLNSARDDGRVALYNSQRSGFVRQAVAGLKGAPTWPKARAKPQDAFLARQVECRYLSEFEVAGGEIARRRSRLIFLPSVLSLSGREREALRAFVEAGGVLVADIGVGTRNEHGTRVETKFAEMMFGVTFEEGVMPRKARSVTFTAASPAFPFASLRAYEAIDIKEPGVATRVTDGTALARIDGAGPAFVVKEHGAGKCVFLNFVVPPDSPAAGALVEDLLALAHVRPVVEVRGADGKRVPVDFGAFRDGGALYCGFVSRGKGGMVSDETPERVTVTFPAARHVYDARHGKYLGETARLETQLAPAIAHVYASVPWRMDALEIKADRPAYTPGDVAQVTATAGVQGPAPGLQVWRMAVTGPDGRARGAFARRLLVRGGRTEIAIPIALNAPAGRWRVSLRDAVSGVTGEATFEVRGAGQ